MKQVLISAMCMVSAAMVPAIAEEAAVDKAGMQSSIMAFGINAGDASAAAQAAILEIEEARASELQIDPEEQVFAEISDALIDNPYAC